MITLELFPSNSTFSTGSLANRMHPIYTQYPTWETHLLIIWPRVEPQWNYRLDKMESLMLVQKGRFKYSVSEDLEGKGHLGTGTNDKVCLPCGCAGYIIDTRSSTTLHQTLLLNSRALFSRVHMQLKISPHPAI